MSVPAQVLLRGLPEFVRAVTQGDTIKVAVYARPYDAAVFPDDTDVEFRLRVVPAGEDAEEATYEGEGQMTVVSTSEQYATIELAAAGRWHFRAEIDGDYVGSDEASIMVPESAFAPADPSPDP